MWPLRGSKIYSSPNRPSLGAILEVLRQFNSRALMLWFSRLARGLVGFDLPGFRCSRRPGGLRRECECACARATTCSRCNHPLQCGVKLANMGPSCALLWSQWGEGDRLLWEWVRRALMSFAVRPDGETEAPRWPRDLCFDLGLPRDDLEDGDTDARLTVEGLLLGAILHPNVSTLWALHPTSWRIRNLRLVRADFSGSKSCP